MQVRLLIGEHFLNWYTNTKLYIRGQRGKSWEVQRKLDEELFHQFNAFMDRHGLLNADQTIGKLEKELAHAKEVTEKLAGALNEFIELVEQKLAIDIPVEASYLAWLKYVATPALQATIPNQRCPHDGGKCHHRCEKKCWRKDNCGVLSEPWEGFPVEGDAPVKVDDDS